MHVTFGQRHCSSVTHKCQTTGQCKRTKLVVSTPDNLNGGILHCVIEDEVVFCNGATVEYVERAVKGIGNRYFFSRRQHELNNLTAKCFGVGKVGSCTGIVGHGPLTCELCWHFCGGQGQRPGQHHCFEVCIFFERGRRGGSSSHLLGRSRVVQVSPLS